MGARPGDDISLDTAPPAEFGGDALLWATWLYYAESRTQNEIAQTLGVSRASVANYLAEARRRGLVKISLEPDLFTAIADSRALAERYGLAQAYVLPGPPPADDPVALRRRLGMAAAQVLAPLLRPEMTLGIAWGRTMLELARAMPERNLPGMRVVQVSGSSLAEADTSPEACTSLMAGRLGAVCRTFYAPAVVSDTALRDALLAEPILQRHLMRLRACDVAVFGVGELTPTITWSDTEIPAGTARAYLDRGAVAVLLARFLAPDGSEVDGPLGGRQIGMALDELCALPVRICVAGGAVKHSAIRAMLAGRYATHLVTDAGTARQLLEETS